VLKLTKPDRSSYLHALETAKANINSASRRHQEYLSLRKPTECPQKTIPEVVAQLLEDKQTARAQAFAIFRHCAGS